MPPPDATRARLADQAVVHVIARIDLPAKELAVEVLEFLSIGSVNFEMYDGTAGHGFLLHVVTLVLYVAARFVDAGRVAP